MPAARTSSTPQPKGLADGQRFETAEAASQYLITEQSICTVPWDDAGAFLRFSVTYVAPDEAAEDALMAETEEARLSKIKLEFLRRTFFRSIFELLKMNHPLRFSLVVYVFLCGGTLLLPLR